MIKRILNLIGKILLKEKDDQILKNIWIAP